MAHGPLVQTKCRCDEMSIRRNVVTSYRRNVYSAKCIQTKCRAPTCMQSKKNKDVC